MHQGFSGKAGMAIAQKKVELATRVWLDRGVSRGTNFHHREIGKNKPRLDGSKIDCKTQREGYFDCCFWPVGRYKKDR